MLRFLVDGTLGAKTIREKLETPLGVPARGQPTILDRVAAGGALRTILLGLDRFHNRYFRLADGSLAVLVAASRR